MPLDPNIALQVQRFRAPDQMGQLNQLMAIQQTQRANALQDYQIQKGMREDQRQTAYRNALQGAVGPDGTLNYDALKAAAVQSGDVGTAMDVDKNIAGTNTLKAQGQLANLKIAKERIDVTSRLLTGVKDEATHQQFRQRFASTFGEGALSSVPDTYDPNWVKSEVDAGMSAKEHVDAEMKRRGFGETKRHNLRQEATAAQKAANSGPMALITAPDGTTTAIGGPNGIGMSGMEQLARGKGIIKEAEKEGEALGKFRGDQYTNILTAEAGSYEMDSKLNRIESLLADVNTGKFKGATTEIKKAARSAGIDLESMGITDDIAPVEAARALANGMALELRNPAGGAGMPGAMSDGDRNFLQAMVPGIENTPEGIKLISQSFRQQNKRHREVARMAVTYRKERGALDEGFSEQLQAYSDKHPLFNVVSSESADADYNAIKKGEYFVGPDGRVRQKP